MSEALARFRARLADRSAVIGVVGLGYVGLPLSLSFASAGFRTVGLDIDPDKVDRLARGESYLRHIPGSKVASVAPRFQPTTDTAALSACDAVILCVPTPLDRHLQPDLRYVTDTTAAIAPHVKSGALVVLESTTWPGTTEEVVRPLLEQHGPRRVGVDCFLAFSPEREDPGNEKFSTTTIPKLVGGSDAVSRDIACAVYGAVVQSVVPVSDTRVAEAAKLYENIFRCVNIALANEMKIVFDRMGLDVWEVIRAAATKPFGFMPFWPGPGMGGHCIPIDPFYLTWKAKEFGVDSDFIETAGKLNRRLPGWVVGKVVDALSARGKPVRGARILVLGLAYKAEVDDLRESPSLPLIELLEGKGAAVSYHDPFIPVVPRTREHAELAGRRSTEPSADFDCFLLTTNHRVYGQDLLRHGVPIVDTRGVLPRGPLVVPA